MSTEPPTTEPPTTPEYPLLTHWIGGAPAAPHGGRTAPVYDPALGVQTKRVALADSVDVDAAVSSAAAAFPAWRELSLARR